MTNEPANKSSGIQNQKEPFVENRLLDPVERISEILFGLIMALTFTGTLSVMQADRAEVRSMLIGAIGCNIAWGLVDAVMYLVSTLTIRGRGLTVLKFVKNTQDYEKARQHISDNLPEVVTAVLDSKDIEYIRGKLVDLEQLPAKGLKISDFKRALGIFFLVVLSTFPPVIPFIFVKEPIMALRVSNIVAIIMMFICGWFLARYAGNNKLLTSVTMALLGIALVLITIALGG